MIRYDLSLKQYCEKYHPAAHFHIGFHVKNRWPVRRKLTPYAFLLKILMLYYPDLWHSVGDSGDVEPNWLDTEYQKEVSKCNYLDDDYFKEHEYKRLHFS